ncbi:MAG: pyrroloquinoline quinone-dependent dehydrogenase [Gemmatimonadota bacterium]
MTSMAPFRAGVLGGAAVLALSACTATEPGPSAAAPGADWTHYAADAGSSKYSPLDQIDATNVSDLEVAWTWESADYDLLARFPDLDVEPVLQSTPIKVGGRLYTSTNLGQAAAIDPVTGRTLWTWSPWEGTDARPSGRANRGVAWWSGPDGGERIFIGSGQHLVALDAATGEPIPTFGDGGRIDLTDDPDTRVTFYRWTSAPLVVRDVVIVGAQQLTPTRNWTTHPPSYIRAYDVRTGALRWRFDPVAQPGQADNVSSADTLWSRTGYAGVWTLLTADPELGYVYLPLKTTTNDWYGGHRPGDNLYGESLVCLDATTGELVWHYQMVHHGLWDYDLPAAPNLVDLTVDGRPIKAVAQVTKQAFVFVFDRVTGEPVWPIEERPVPASTVPGEVAAPTQPFPTRPAPFDLQGITRDDLIDFTPELRAEAERILDGFVWGEMFTPPSVRDDRPGGTQGTLLMPGWVGGANWNGAAVDPETGVLYVPSVTSPNVTALVAPDPDSSDFAYVRGLPREVPMPQGLPLLKPPYGRITAIDLDTGEHLWMKANGPGPRDHPLLRDLDVPWLGQRGRPAPLLTKTLLFLGEGSKDALSVLPIAGGRAFRAWDKRTGEVVWETELAAGTSGAPMTYLADGKQYIVVPIGDHETRGQFVALRLP